jgi:hypothetical protein
MIYKPVAVDFAWFSSGGGLLTDIRALEDTETAAKEAASMFDRDSLHGLRAIAALWRVSSLIVLQSNYVDKFTILRREYRGPIFKFSPFRSMDLLK